MGAAIGLGLAWRRGVPRRRVSLWRSRASAWTGVVFAEGNDALLFELAQGLLEFDLLGEQN